MRDCEACRLKVELVLDDDEMFYTLKSEVFTASAKTAASSAEQAHLTFERTAAYVDEALAGEELQAVKDHLTGCEQCATAAHDLRAFRNQVAPGLNREYQPHPPPAAKENLWRRFVAAVPSFPPRSPALVVGSALAALLMIAAGWLIWQAIERRGKAPKVVQTNPSPTTAIVTPVVSPAPTREGAAATVIAQLNDGARQVVLDGNGKLSGVDHLPPAYQQMIRNALSSRQLEKPPLMAGLVRPEGLLMRARDNQGVRF